MCDRETGTGATCQHKARYSVHIDTNPFPLGPNGAYGMGSGAMQLVCAQHLAATADDLLTLPHRKYGAAPTVRPLASH